MTWPPTLADDLDKVEKLMTDQPQPICPTTEVRAPCCQRKVAADMVVDVRGVEDGEADWLCDGCRDRVFRDAGNDWTWSRLMQQLGAPWSDVRQERAKEIAHDLRRAIGSADEDGIARMERDGANLGELISIARERLPDEPVDLMSERPAVDALDGQMPSQAHNR